MTELSRSMALASGAFLAPRGRKFSYWQILSHVCDTIAPTLISQEAMSAFSWLDTDHSRYQTFRSCHDLAGWPASVTLNRD